MAALPRRLHRSSTALTPVPADPDREHARVDNAVAAYTRETVLVVQLSDLHFNERVELPSNRYDFSVASARLAKLAARIKHLAACFNAQKLVVACFGDFLNSDRRL